MIVPAQVKRHENDSPYDNIPISCNLVCTMLNNIPYARHIKNISRFFLAELQDQNDNYYNLAYSYNIILSSDNTYINLRNSWEIMVK